MIAVALFDRSRLLGALIVKDVGVAPDVIVYQKLCYLRQGESHEYRQYTEDGSVALPWRQRQGTTYVAPDNQQLDH